ncbi:MAG: hypothetical protein V1738_02260 [Patescibacteria group bacterium]
MTVSPGLEQARLTVRISLDDLNNFHVKVKYPGQRNPYITAVGQKLTDLPAQVARQYGTYPNPHLTCAAIAVEFAYGIIPSFAARDRRAMLLNAITLREHGLHLVTCYQQGLYTESPDDAAVFIQTAISIAKFGQDLALALAAPYGQSGAVTADLSTAPWEKIAAIADRATALTEPAYQLVRSVTSLPLRTFGQCDVRHRAIIGQLFCGGDWQTTLIPPVEEPAENYRRPNVFGPSARLHLAVDRLIRKKYAHHLATVLHHLPNHDPFFCVLAEAAETVILLDQIRQLSKLSKEISRPADGPRAVSKNGITLGIEAPRGTLHHQLQFDDAGRLIFGQVLIPTERNRPALESFLENELQTAYRTAVWSRIESYLTSLIVAQNPCGFDLGGQFVDFVWE